MKTNITVLLINWMYFPYFPPQVRSSSLSVKCQLTVNLTNEHNQKSSYVLVSDSGYQMYVIHQGTVVMVIKTPSIITAVSVYLQVKHKIFHVFILQFTEILFDGSWIDVQWKFCEIWKTSCDLNSNLKFRIWWTSCIGIRHWSSIYIQ